MVPLQKHPAQAVPIAVALKYCFFFSWNKMSETLLQEAEDEETFFNILMTQVGPKTTTLDPFISKHPLLSTCELPWDL